MRKLQERNPAKRNPAERTPANRFIRLAKSPDGHLGRIEESIACFTDSLRRNPLAPNSCLLAVGLIEYLEANYGQSASALARMTGYQLQRTSALAAACAQVGYQDAAQKATREFMRLSQDVPVCPKGKGALGWREFWRLAYPGLRDDDFEHMLDGIGKAALPV